MTKTPAFLLIPLLTALGAPPARAAVLPPVVVTAARERSYAPAEVELGGLAGGATTVLDVPASISVFTRSALDDQGQRTLADAVRRDALAADAYAPVGYYQDLQLRGFPLDLGTGYRIDGLTVAGEQNVALENKSRVEIWSGTAGLEAGAASPGGVVDYVTARPADVRALTLATDARGGRYAAFDAGVLLGADRRSGVRVNAALEDLRPPVEHAEGRRRFASLAADWGFSDAGSLRFDVESQRRVQNSVPGYQLLGGTRVPPLPDPTRLLGWQSWTKPVAVDALNASLRLEDELAPGLRLRAAAGRSFLKIDDNIAFPYGCGSLSTFCSNGDYSIWDFRSAGERRRADDFVLSLSGDGKAGRASGRWAVGAESFARDVDMSSWIYDEVGTGNIFAPDAAVSASTSSAPAARRVLDHAQRSLFARGALALGRWELQGGGRLTLVRETTWDAATGAELAGRSDARILPAAAVLYRPGSASTLYASYSEGLELGGVAPSWTSNAQAAMPARATRQEELGAKREAGGLLLTGAVFRAEAPYEYVDAANDYVQRGREIHSGVELSAAGRAAPGLSLTASAAWLRAVQSGTGDPAYDGRDVPNVPRLQGALFADQELFFLPGAGVFAGWRASSPKPVLPDGSVAIAGWQVFDAGARWVFSAGAARVSLRLSVDNVFDVRYWRDAAQQYLFTGLPRTARLTATADF
ncbi:MAG: TonB-dependent siderophore receptor [Elusimicrobia bacterium]|nr:TonB-dependent siderophore receptor [Elusimicrobiota bacterium]